jgi:ClpX C4-type zinc finger
LWLCGASGTGIFLAKTGLIELPKRMVLQMAGTCSFCAKDRCEVFGVAGVVGREQRICDECIGLCFDILADEMKDQQKARLAAGAPDSSRLSWADDELESLQRSAGTDPRVDPRDLIERIQARLEPPRRRTGPVVRDFHCSFCDRARRDVRKLISGPRVFICDDCTGDAGGLLAASGWRFGA